MHISQILHVVAILAGTISHVTGALTQEQIIDAIDVLTIMVNTANSDANSLTPATADPNVQV